MTNGAGQRLPMPRLAIPIVCLITDRSLVEADALPKVIAEAVAGGVNLIQLREKDLPTRDLLALARRIRACLAPPALFVVNGRADIAFAAHADGAHLPSDGLPVPGARSVLRSGSLVGRSAHDQTEVAKAAAEGADYVELGTVYPSRSHPGGRTIGLQGITESTRYGIPLLAVGGITPENAAEALFAGADGVAVISAILGAAEPRLAAERLARAVGDAYTARMTPGSAPCSSR